MDRLLLLRDSDVPLQWYEAVALVRSVADALEAGRLGFVPSANVLALDHEGSVHVAPKAAAAPQRAVENDSDGLAEFLSELPTEGQDPPHLTRRNTTKVEAGRQTVNQLRQLLGELLPADAPAQLRAISEDTAAATLTEFRAALAFFERPNSKADCRAVADRLLKATSQRALEDEVERLRRKAQAEDNTPDDRKTARPSHPIVGRRVVLLVACGVGAIAALVGLLIGTTAPVGSQMPSAAGSKPLVERLRAAAGSVLGRSQNGESTVATAGNETAAARRPPQPRRVLTRKTSVTPEPRDKNGSSIVAGALPLAPLAPLPAQKASSALPDLSLPSDVASVFSRRDADVQPPKLMRPHLPTAASIGLPREQFGAVDVVVDVDGRVEQVRLVSTSAERRYYDIMILPAIKAWIFRPATRSGQRVRYRLTIPLT